MKIFLFSLFFLIFGCKERKKVVYSENWGECVSNSQCSTGRICLKHKCVDLEKVPVTTSKKAPAGMVYIPAGKFYLGNTGGGKLEKPQKRIFVDSFFMDKHEVTWGEYNKCVKDKICSLPRIEKQLGDNYPVRGITFNDATRYCRYADKRLPSEFEWEKAARGTDARRYPWGESPPDCKKAVFKQCSSSNPKPVGSCLQGKSPYGTMDQVGNVWEFTATLKNSWDKVNDPKGSKAGYQQLKAVEIKDNKDIIHVIRGGSCLDGVDSIRTTIRQLIPAEFFAPQLGFRCAR
ncbi:MAG: SUMF1/EgtB/PvdO family nonheme iron enzyme [Deltaproteobacteria bacterium]|nr:SUMF1/EgtB/PvdO family nonheme iron enzyme [Deltaproteobacteria bacterium]